MSWKVGVNLNDSAHDFPVDYNAFKTIFLFLTDKFLKIVWGTTASSDFGY